MIERILFNLKKFIGRHQKFMEVSFLCIYVLLQLILLNFDSMEYTGILVVIFLFFLSLERIFVRMGVDYEKMLMNKKEKVMDLNKKILEKSYLDDMRLLEDKIKQLEIKSIKLSFDKR